MEQQRDKHQADPVWNRVDALLSDKPVTDKSSGEMQVFTGKTAVFVHRRIAEARNKVCDAMCAMRSNKPLGNGNFGKSVLDEEAEALLQSPTYQRLYDLLQELESLACSSEPAVTPAVHEVRL